MPPSPTTVPATWALLGTASPVKVRSERGRRAGGQEGLKRAAMGAACVRVSLDPLCPPCLLVKLHLRCWGLKCPKSLFTCPAAEAHWMCGEGCNRMPIHTLLCCLLLPAAWLWTYSHSEMAWLYTEVMLFSLWAKDDRGPELKVRRQRHRRNSSTFPSSITSLVLLFSFEHHSNYQQLTGVCDCALPLS